MIVAGDFNTFWGTHEIYLFMHAAGLRSANAEGLPSFPARKPRIELDFILVSDGIEVTVFRIPASPSPIIGRWSAISRSTTGTPPGRSSA